MAYVVACDYNFFPFVCLSVFWFLFSEFLLNDWATLSSPDRQSIRSSAFSPKSSPATLFFPSNIFPFEITCSAYVRLPRFSADWFPIFCLWKRAEHIEWGTRHMDSRSKVSNGYFYCLNCSSCIVQAFIIHIGDIVHSSVATIDVFTLNKCISIDFSNMMFSTSIYYLV